MAGFIIILAAASIGAVPPTGVIPAASWQIEDEKVWSLLETQEEFDRLIEDHYFSRPEAFEYFRRTGPSGCMTYNSQLTKVRYEYGGYKQRAGRILRSELSVDALRRAVDAGVLDAAAEKRVGPKLKAMKLHYLERATKEMHFHTMFWAGVVSKNGETHGVINGKNFWSDSVVALRRLCAMRVKDRNEELKDWFEGAE